VFKSNPYSFTSTPFERSTGITNIMKPLFDKFKPKVGAGGNLAADIEVAQAEAPHLARVNWRSDPGLRKLYFWAFIICIASATTGYDGYATSG
jgi:hypothetical protein